MKKLSILLLFISLSSFAQKEKSKYENKFWIQGGIGKGRDYNFFANTGLNYSHKNKIFSVDYFSRKYLLFGTFSKIDFPEERTKNISVLGGYLFPKKHFLNSIQTGFCIENGIVQGKLLNSGSFGKEFERFEYRNQIGLVIQAQSILYKKHAGFGVKIIFKTNKYDSFVGFITNLNFGKLSQQI